MGEYRCEAVCLKDSGQALLIEIDGEEFWIPQSQILPDSEVYDAGKNSEGTLVISEWIATQKGIL